jgi:hypothetical protein
MAIATDILASANRLEYLLLLIKKQWADAHLRDSLCVVHFVTPAAISCNWSGKMYVTTPILRSGIESYASLLIPALDERSHSLIGRSLWESSLMSISPANQHQQKCV